MQKQKVLQQVLPEPEGEETTMVARICRIGRWDYLITDCYTQGEHVVRIAQTKKEYSLYDVGEKRWNNTLMRDAWQTRNGWSVRYLLEKMQADAVTEQEIACFTGRKEAAGRALRMELDKIRQEKREQRAQRKEERQEEDMESTPELPDGFKEWAMKSIKNIPHMLLYKRNHNKVTIWCGGCGQVMERRIRDKWEPWDEEIRVPRAGEIAFCPNCGEVGTYYHEGRKKMDAWSKSVYILQKTRLDEIVIRMFMVNRTEEKGESQKVFLDEKMRKYIGKNGPRKYFKGYSYGEQWGTYNPGGYFEPWKFEEGKIYPGYMDTIRDTECFRYCDVQQYKSVYKWKGEPEIEQIAKVLAAYQKMPQIEFLWKKGMKKLTGDIVSGFQRQMNRKAKNWEDFLGIRKERLKSLGDIDADSLSILQMEKKGNLHMSADQIEQMQDFCRGNDWKNRMEDIMKYMSFTKCLNRINQYAEEYGNRKKMALTEYADYLSIREELGYDMTNSVYLHPKQLHRAHADMVKEREQRRTAGFIKEKNKEFSRIAKRYKALNKKYGYVKDGYQIRPARNAGEIIMEGRILHHCVGGDNYLRKHDSGTSSILFLRKKDEPDIPYITIEIQETKVIQWYGIHDTKPDRELMQQYIDEYTNRLEQKGEKRHEEYLTGEQSGRLQPVQAAV